MKPAIYLDYAAATPMDERVLATMQPYFTEKFYNPSATYWAAHEVSKDLSEARGRIAHWLGARPSEVIFTAGGTEANNLAVHGIMQQYPTANIVVSMIEHDSVLTTARRYNFREVAVTPEGFIDIEKLAETIDDQTVVVSIMYANNEIGTIQPLAEISQLLSGIRAKRRTSDNKLPLYLHADAAQAANYLDLHAARLGLDLMSLNGGKIYGPKQSGILYVKSGVRLQPVILGGGQEQGLRSGTENVPAAIGLAAALDIAQEMRHDEAKRLQNLQALFTKELQAVIPKIKINGSQKKHLPNNVHITIPGQDNERLLFALDEAGIMAAAGSACSASNEEASHVLHALGLSDEAARASLRFSMGRHTTEEEIRMTVKVLADLAS